MSRNFYTERRADDPIAQGDVFFGFPIQLGGIQGSMWLTETETDEGLINLASFDIEKSCIAAEYCLKSIMVLSQDCDCQFASAILCCIIQDRVPDSIKPSDKNKPCSLDEFKTLDSLDQAKTIRGINSNLKSERRYLILPECNALTDAHVVLDFSAITVVQRRDLLFARSKRICGVNELGKKLLSSRLSFYITRPAINWWIACNKAAFEAYIKQEKSKNEAKRQIAYELGCSENDVDPELVQARVKQIFPSYPWQSEI